MCAQAVKTGIAKLVSSTNAKHILNARLSENYTKSYNQDMKKFLNYLKYEGHCFFDKAYSESDVGDGDAEQSSADNSLFQTVDPDCFSVDEVCLALPLATWHLALPLATWHILVSAG